MSEEPKMYQSAFQIFSQRYTKKLRKNKELTSKQIEDMIIQKWKFLPTEQRQPYINRFNEEKLKYQKQQEEQVDQDDQDDNQEDIEEPEPIKKVKQN